MTAGERDGRGYPRDHDGYSPYGAEVGGYPDWRDGDLPATRNEFSDQRGSPHSWSSGYDSAYGSATGYPPDAGYHPAGHGYPEYPEQPYAPYGYDERGGYRPAGYPPAEPPSVGGGYPPPGYQAGHYADQRYPEPHYPEQYYPAGYADPGYADPGYADPGYQPPGYSDRAAPGYPPGGYPPAGPEGHPEPGYPDDGYRARYADPYPADGTAFQPGVRGGSPRTDAWQRWPGDDEPPRSDAEPEDPGWTRVVPEHAGQVPGRAREARPGGDPRMSRRRPGDGRGVGGGAAPRPRKRRGLPLWQELPLLLVIALCLAVLVRTFLLQAFYIPSGSMEETLIAGDRVLVNKVVYNFREPARGEVVVFQGTDAWEPIGAQDDDIGLFARGSRAIGDLVGVTRPGASDYIKRVIGLPGDTVSCCDVDGRVFVNGQPLDEDYVIRDSPLDDVPLGDCRGRRFDEVVVQPGHMFVMGDHRQVSQDSRCQGQIPLDNVIGRAFIIVWPSDRWTGLSQPDTFTAVPTAQGAAVEQLPTAADAGAGARPVAEGLGVAAVFGASMPAFRRSFRGDSPSLRRRVRSIRRRLAA